MISQRLRGINLLGGRGQVPDLATLHRLVTKLAEIDHSHIIADGGMTMILI